MKNILFLFNCTFLFVLYVVSYMEEGVLGE